MLSGMQQQPTCERILLLHSHVMPFLSSTIPGEDLVPPSILLILQCHVVVYSERSLVDEAPAARSPALDSALGLRQGVSIGLAEADTVAKMKLTEADCLQDSISTVDRRILMLVYAQAVSTRRSRRPWRPHD